MRISINNFKMIWQKLFEKTVLPCALFCAFMFNVLVSCKTIGGEALNQAKNGRTFLDQGDFIVGAGDRLEIRVAASPNIDGAYTVSPSGHLSLPLVGIITVSGKSLSQIASDVTKKLEPLFKHPQVALNLSVILSFKVFFDGEIARPGVYALTEKTSLLKAISLAGGQGKFASGKIVIIRTAPDGTAKRFITRQSDLISGSSEEMQFSLERDDYIYLE